MSIRTPVARGRWPGPFSRSSGLYMSPSKINIQVSVPEAVEGEVMLALNRAGGVITDVRREGEHSTAIGAALPAKGLPAFRTWLQDYSKGQGRISEGLP